jgi:hypothetical protein
VYELAVKDFKCAWFDENDYFEIYIEPEGKSFSSIPLK